MRQKYVCRLPGKKSIAIIKRDHKVISQSYSREYSFVLKKSRDCYVYDIDGRRYLDFAAGIAVANVGHTNPEVVRAVTKQVKLSTHAAFADFYAELPVKFVETLLTFLPKDLNNVFLSNSGTEAIEAAYKCARWHSKKKWTIAFTPCFHGRTMGSLSMTNSLPVQRERYSPFLPVKHTPYPYEYRWKKKEDCATDCLNLLEKRIKSCKNNLASIFFEPVSGEGGYIVPPKLFVKGLRRLCNEYNVLLCDDEVQAGLYRTGTFLAIENFNIKPDIVSISKAIGGGIPLGATVANKKIMDWPRGSHANTFGGNLIACAAGIATLNFMKKKGLGEKSKKIGGYMLERLKQLEEKYETVGDVRGLGLMIGIELVKDKRTKKHAIEERQQILCKASEKGLLLLPAGKSVIRICPPLTLTKEQADLGIDILEDSIKEVSK